MKLEPRPKHGLNVEATNAATEAAWLRYLDSGFGIEEEAALKLILPWSVLAQANHRMIPRRGGKGLTLSTDYRKKKDAAALLLLRQMPPGVPVWYIAPVAVTMRFYEPDRRKRDPSNLQKLIEDALSGIAYADDSQICRLTWERAGLDRANPRVEITVEAVAERAA